MKVYEGFIYFLTDYIVKVRRFMYGITTIINATGMGQVTCFILLANQNSRLCNI